MLPRVVGASVGVSVGVSVGASLGVSDGLVLGASEGVSDGLVLGASVAVEAAFLTVTATCGLVNRGVGERKFKRKSRKSLCN